MSDSLVVIGEGGRIAAVNQATLQLLGYEEDDLIGQPPDILFADGTVRGNGLETLHERGIIQRGEKTLRTKDGRGIPVFYSGSVLRNHNGQELAVVRRKGNKNTLLSPDDDQLDDGVLAPYLHGVNAEVFEMLFGIDHCFYLVSVSQDAMSSFERRGIPFRDTFDSALDDIE